ncbi:hypothetical protein NQZ68_040727 [Dissostichus eleginoides]|nr:hypothetical protein NQZ68_040727 [Dissostichus eleginoides]
MVPLPAEEPPVESSLLEKPPPGREGDGENQNIWSPDDARISGFTTSRKPGYGSVKPASVHS